MKNLLRKTLSLVLTASFVCGFSACGRESDPGALSAAPEEFIYTPEFKDVEAAGKGNLYIENSLYIEDTLYFTGSFEDENGHYSDSGIYTLKAGETKPEKLSCDIGEASSIMCFTPDSNGNLLLYVQTHDPASSNALDESAEKEDKEVPPVLQFVRIDREGRLLDSRPLDASFQAMDDTYSKFMQEDREGNICLAIGESVHIFQPDGKLLFTAAAGGWIQSLIKAPDGTVLAGSYGESNFELKPLDTSAKVLGTPRTEMFSEGFHNNILIGASSGSALPYIADGKMWLYDFEKKELSMLFDCLDMDINSNEVRGLCLLEDGRILVLTALSGSSTASFQHVTLTKTNAGSVPGKTILTLGTMSIGTGLKRRIIDFNKTNPDYRIEIVDYSGAGWQEAFDRMNSDIMAGKCPDILDLNQGINIRQYVSKGILEDLKPYFDGDKELKREDYLPNVLEAFEIDGKMYTLVNRYSISTLMAKASEMNGKTGWTLEEMIAYIESMPKEASVMEYASSSFILDLLLTLNMNKYVDWTSGSCGFDTDAFRSLLEFCSRFPSEDQISVNEDEPNIHDKISDGSVLLLDLQLTNPEDYQMYQQVFGEPVTFIGYPSEDRKGSFFMPEEQLGMSSSSKYKDGVWQFLRMGITKEYQETTYEVNNGVVEMYGFSVRKDSLEQQFSSSMTPLYSTDENGLRTERSKWSTSFGQGKNPFTVDIYASSREDIDTIRGLIENIDKSYQADNQLLSIANEEAAAYFQGQKTIDEVSAIIQQRAQLYIDENR